MIESTLHFGVGFVDLGIATPYCCFREMNCVLFFLLPFFKILTGCVGYAVLLANDLAGLKIS